MKVPYEKIEKTACQEVTRYALQAVFVDEKKSRIVATDGHALAVIPASLDKGEKGGLISTAALTEARKLKATSIKQTATHTVIKADGKTVKFLKPKGQFPIFDKVVPKVKGKPTIVLDCDLLMNLWFAMADDRTRPKHLSLWIQDSQKQVYVRSSTGGAYGVLMPVRLDRDVHKEK